MDFENRGKRLTLLLHLVLSISNSDHTFANRSETSPVKIQQRLPKFKSFTKRNNLLYIYDLVRQLLGGDYYDIVCDRLVQYMVP